MTSADEDIALIPMYLTEFLHFYLITVLLISSIAFPYKLQENDIFSGVYFNFNVTVYCLWPVLSIPSMS